jgi:hypothetical protein
MRRILLGWGIPVMIATFCASRIGNLGDRYGRPVAPNSSDEIGLVDHASRPATANADEDALVQPVEIGSGSLDLG